METNFFSRGCLSQICSSTGASSAARGGFISQNPKFGTTTTGSGLSQSSSSNPKPQFPAVKGNSPGGGSAGGGSFDDDFDEKNVPRKSEWETNPDYWNNYQYDPSEWKKKKSEDQCPIPEEIQNKADIDELPNSLDYIYNIEGKAAK